MAIEAFLQPSAAPEYSDWEVQRTNLVTNPSYEVTSGTVEVRRNRAINPNMAVDETGWNTWAGSGGLALSSSRVATGGPTNGAFRRATITTVGASLGTSAALPMDPANVTPGQVLTLSVWIRPSKAVDVNIRADHYIRASATLVSSTSLPYTPIPANVWTRMWVTTTVPATADASRLAFNVNAAPLGVGDTVDVTNYLSEVSPDLKPYFDGSTQPHHRENLTPNPGGEHFTPSVGWGPMPGTSFWGRTSTSGNFDSYAMYATINSNAGTGLQATTSSVMSPGSYVSASAWVKLNSTGKLVAATIRSDTAGAADTTQTFVSNGGWQFVKVEGHVVPSTGTIQAPMLMLYVVTGGYVATLFADNVIIENAATVGPQFSGNTPDTAGLLSDWSGTTNASLSYQTDLDLTASWSGTAHASASVLLGNKLASRQTVATNSVAFQSAWRSTQRTKSARVRAVSTLGYNITLFYPITEYALEAGTYTWSMDVFVPSGSPPIRLVDATTGTEGAPSTVNDDWERLSVTFTLPSANTALLRVRTASTGTVAGTEWWLDGEVLNTGTDTAYLDGSLADLELLRYGWTGTADASTSTFETRTTLSNNTGRTGGGTAVEDYVVRLDATPTSATDGTPSTPEFSATLQSGDLFDMFRQRGRGIMLHDDEKRGVMIGTVDGFSQSPESVRYDALSPLTRLVGRIETDVFNGTFQGYMDYLIGLADPTIPIQYTADVATIPITVPAFTDSAWRILNDICMAHRVECVTMNGTVTFRPIRGALFLYDNIVDSSHEYSTGPKARYVEVTNYNATYSASAQIWPRGDQVERFADTVPLIGSGQTLVLDLEVGENASVATINQPVGLNNALTTPSYSHYVMMDNRNRVVAGGTWDRLGGSFTVELLENGTIIRVTIVAPSGRPDLSPYQVARLDPVTDEPVNSLRLWGSGVLLDPVVTRWETGANPGDLVEEVGTSIDVPTVTDAAIAADMAQKAVAEYSMPIQTISGTLTVPQLTATSEEMLELVPAEVAPGDEFEWLETQLFSTLIGARIRYAYSYFRITNVEFAPGQITFDAVADTIIDDAESLWSGLTYEQLDTVIGGLTYEEWEAIPLYFGENAYGAGYYGQGIYGGDTYGS